MYLSGLLFFFLAINFRSGADLDDLPFTIQGWHFTLTSVAAGTITSLFPFGLKNLVVSMTKPGSLVVPKADIVSVKLGQDVHKVLCAANSLLVAQGSSTNASLCKISKKMGLGGWGVKRSAGGNATDTVQVFDEHGTSPGADSLEMASFQHNYQDRFSSGSMVGLISDHFRIVNLSLGSIQREVFLEIEHQKSRTSKIIDTKSLEHFKSIRSMMADIIECCVDIIQVGLANMPANKASQKQTRFLVTATFPVDITTDDCLHHSIARHFFKLHVRTGVTLFYFMGFVTYTLAMFDLLSNWQLFFLNSLSVPIVVSLPACFNKTILWRLCRTFQTIFVSLHSFNLAVALCVIWRQYPLKLGGVIFGFPFFLASGFLDAYPERGRAFTSRMFFMCNLIGLSTIFLAITSGKSDLQDQAFPILGRQYRMSSVATSAISSLFPFGLKNLIMSVRKPGAVVVLKGDIVSVKLDRTVLFVLRAAQRLLASQGASNKTLAKMASTAALESGRTQAPTAKRYVYTSRKLARVHVT